MVGLRRRWKMLLGLAIALGGLAVLGAVGGYEVYASRARSQLGRLAVAAPLSPWQVLPTEWAAVQAREQPPSVKAAAPVHGESFTAWPAPGPGASDSPGGLQDGGPTGSDDAAGPSADGTSAAPSPRFRWVDWATLPTTEGVAPRAAWISIPAIGVDSPVVEVGVVWDGKARVWQRPKNSVGHHEGTANPGELGNVVLSGHINSPVRGEGNVFRRLPELPGLLGLALRPEVLIYTQDHTYVYQVVRSDVAEPDARDLFEPTREPTLTLVTCVPDLVFSHRLVITAWLVRVGEGGRQAPGWTVKGMVVEPNAGG